jgi:hypothetical protein
MLRFTSSALIAFSIVFSVTAYADCDSAVTSLEKSLLSRPNKCKEDSDCDGFYLRADPCASAIVLPKSSVSDEFKEMITKKQEAAKKACAKEWEDKTICTPVPFHAVCVHNRCFDRKVDKPAPPTGNL